MHYAEVFVVHSPQRDGRGSRDRLTPQAHSNDVRRKRSTFVRLYGLRETRANQNRCRKDP